MRFYRTLSHPLDTGAAIITTEPFRRPFSGPGLLLTPYYKCHESHGVLGRRQLSDSVCCGLALHNPVKQCSVFPVLGLSLWLMGNDFKHGSSVRARPGLAYLYGWVTVEEFAYDLQPRSTRSSTHKRENAMFLFPLRIRWRMDHCERNTEERH